MRHRVWRGALLAIALLSAAPAWSAELIASGSLSATGSSEAFAAGGAALSGGRRESKSLLVVTRGTGVGTIALERSPDGTNWYPVPIDAAGSPAVLTVNNAAASLDIFEKVPGVTWRLTFTRTSGTVTWEVWR